MYRIRTVCQNPVCQSVFEVEFAEIDPLEGKTAELASELCQVLRGKGPTTYKGVEIPVFIECPKCNSVFSRYDLTFFVYNANATQPPH